MTNPFLVLAFAIFAVMVIRRLDQIIELLELGKSENERGENVREV